MYWKNPVKSWREKSQRYRWLKKKGELVSWTRIVNPPSGFTHQKSYVVGMVDFGEAGRVTGQLVGEVDEEKLQKGLKVEGVLRRLYEDGEAGVITYGVKFKMKYSK